MLRGCEDRGEGCETEIGVRSIELIRRTSGGADTYSSVGRSKGGGAEQRAYLPVENEPDKVSIEDSRRLNNSKKGGLSLRLCARK